MRPDAKAVLGKGRLLIVEVDESSHDTYVCAREREREAILAKHAPRGATIHLIRFNPDAYDCAETGQRVPTCFKYNKEAGTMTVNPARQKDWNARLVTLKATIDEIVAHKHEAIAVPECCSRTTGTNSSSLFSFLRQRAGKVARWQQAEVGGVQAQRPDPHGGS